jgi:hypothetical protein
MCSKQILPMLPTSQIWLCKDSKNVAYNIPTCISDYRADEHPLKDRNKFFILASYATVQRLYETEVMITFPAKVQWQVKNQE